MGLCMSDLYIDYFEVDEYGTHFCTSAKSLIGVSTLVDVQLLIGSVEAAVKAVNAELDKAGVQRSILRDGSGDVEAKAEGARDVLSRFWSFLNSLDRDISVDREAFFKGDKQGTISRFKPADIKAKLHQAIAGFSADANKNLPDASKWQGKLEAARDALAAALETTSGSRGESIQASAALQNAREAFLTAYNGVAKRLILGLLISLGRRDEYESFFKDLQVNEGKAKGKAPPLPGNKGEPT